MKPCIPCFALAALLVCFVHASSAQERFGQSGQRSSVFNDTMMFRMHPVNGLILDGGNQQNNVRLILDNNAAGGHRYLLQSTGNSSVSGQGKLVIADITAAAPRLTIDSAGHVGINTFNPHPAALLDLTGISGGLLLPRLTTTQRSNLVDPPDGMMLYDKTLQRFIGAWNDTMMVIGQHWQEGANGIYLDSLFATNVGIGTQNPHAAAVLDLSEAAGGLLVPQLTSVEIGALPGPPPGLLMYNMTEGAFAGIFNDTILNIKPLWQQIGNTALLDSNFVTKIGIGTQNVHPAALMEIKGNNGGLLLPRLTSSQREALPGPPQGLIMYDKTIDRYVGAWNDTMMVFNQYWQENGSTAYLDSNFVTRVGLGTDNAEARLHVAGDALITDLENPEGKLLLSDAAGRLTLWNDTMMFTISPLVYQSSGEVMTSFGSSGIGIGLSEGSGALWAHMDLEHNLINDTLFFSFVDASASNLTFEYIRTPHSGGASDIMATYVTSGSESSVRSHAMAIPGGQMTDLTQFSYYLKVTSGSWNNNLSVRACYLRGRRQYGN